MGERINYTTQTLGQIDDILSNDAYLVEFASVVGGGGKSFDLALRCRNVPIPATTVEPIEVEIHGFKLMFRGRRRHGENDWALQFIETKNSVVVTALRTWAEYCAGTDSGNSSGYKKDYSTTADLTVFDTMGKVSQKYRLYNVWCRGLDEYTLDSSNQEAANFTGHFSYDYVKQIYPEVTTA